MNSMDELIKLTQTFFLSDNWHINLKIPGFGQLYHYWINLICHTNVGIAFWVFDMVYIPVLSLSTCFVFLMFLSHGDVYNLHILCFVSFQFSFMKKKVTIIQNKTKKEYWYELEVKKENYI